MYVGRFAPSPTGLLHIGSLLTAVASYLDARSQHGRWLVRMEDLDPPREMPGASTAILATLEAFALHWDGEVVYQSKRHHLYEAALAQLRAHELVYPCYCSRKIVQAEAQGMGVDGVIYSGRCASLGADTHLCTNKIPAWRLRVGAKLISFQDAIQGWQQQYLAGDVGDFVLLRADGFWAYQLAVVVDDAAQGVNHVVRGQDLLVSTPRQIYLQQLLGLPQPNYAHLPLLTNALGQKWSKQTQAPALDLRKREALLRQVLVYLGLPQAPQVDSLADLLGWAVQHWQLGRVSPQAIVTA
ncbi:tRNA glutamyl-Q(34) synthetase GluQRS [Snodgrassella alvi]|uniref:Glutamyl-Q tRNA(Asp) synthetase n=1 Tax=Snodgrassella alvi TaxID=1196083 RepID=A0A2N9WR88_9NEIS|nr:tRNA glutamyl-Q(34) synthetase GluQRS [Snodgrassella alvi]PIT12377.1 tRNA glutamyl-Q(34) synthetase GluQRS [Snodgrassella alvi]PIT16573.1 tRNA glutamyl-Q(34) synthetase GluQRS [Snodgrassella alvi]PIT18435.1 tRNA glutamyl-Q(34) synthetase GluQRS [Snodgrassella alvi]